MLKEWKSISVPKISSLHSSLVTTSVICVFPFLLCVFPATLLQAQLEANHLFRLSVCLLTELKSTGTAHHFSFLLNSTDYRILRMDEDHDRMYVGSKDYILSLDLHDINKEPLIVRKTSHTNSKLDWTPHKFPSNQLVDLSRSDPLACRPAEEDWMCAVRERHQCEYSNEGGGMKQFN